MYDFYLEYFEDGVRNNDLSTAACLTFSGGVVTSQTLTQSYLSIVAAYNYTRPDGVMPTFSAWLNTRAGPGILQFGGESQHIILHLIFYVIVISDPYAFDSVS
jgi:hypothetical protein